MITSGKSSLANFSQAGMVIVAGKVAIGASGAVGAQTGKGFAVTRTAAGRYTITLDGSGGCANILFALADVVFATQTNTQTATTLTHTASARTITVACNDAGTIDTPADPPSGSFLQVFVVAASQ